MWKLSDIRLSPRYRLALGAIAVLGVVLVISLIAGALIRACDNRTVERHEGNVNAATTKVEESEKVVEEKKQESSEIKGELKVRKEEVEKTNVEVNEKIVKRIEAADRRQRVRRNKLRNVNGADINRILNEADSNR